MSSDKESISGRWIVRQGTQEAWNQMPRTNWQENGEWVIRQEGGVYMACVAERAIRYDMLGAAPGVCVEMVGGG